MEEQIIDKDNLSKQEPTKSAKRKLSANKRGASSLPPQKMDIWTRNEMEKHRKMAEANLKRAK